MKAYIGSAVVAVLLLQACVGPSITEQSSKSDSKRSEQSTSGVLCAYAHKSFNQSPSVNAMSTSGWSCSAGVRSLSSNGLPDHAVGTFPNAHNPIAMVAQQVEASVPLYPEATSEVTRWGGPRKLLGYLLNGVKIDPGTAGTCNDSGTHCPMGPSFGAWNIEALGQTSFNFGVDGSNAHVQPGGTYHYHGMPEEFINQLGKGVAMTLVGWAADGFPIYARYGHAVPGDAGSDMKVVQPSYRLKSKPDPDRPATTQFAMGAFIQDYEYIAKSGDLDECNGRSGPTPEFPSGIYHYYITDTYPYIQRCLKGMLS